MARIPRTIVDEIRTRADAVSIIGQRVSLEASGSNFKGLCPFHSEKTPSFFVYPETASYYCFGCKASGSVITFMMETENVSYYDALVRLARMTGVSLPKFDNDNAVDEFEDLYVLLQRAHDCYRSHLDEAKSNSAIKRYISDRGLTNKVLSKYGIGYAPPGWDNIKNQLSEADPSMLQEVGLTRLHVESQRVYDYFRNRLMFPIRNLYGRVIGFGGRVITEDDQPKYLNSPKSRIFDKGSELYGFYEVTKHVRRIQRLVLVEGYMDVLALAQNGIDYAVATLGTATSTAHFDNMFRRTSEVVCCFDADEAGRNAAWSALTRALGTLRQGRDIRFMFLPEGHDPDTFVREHNKETFEDQLDNAIHIADYFVQQLASGRESKSVQERVRFADEVTKLIQTVPHRTTQIALKQEVVDHFPEMAHRLNELLRIYTPTEGPKRSQPSRRREPIRIVKPYLGYLFHSESIWQHLHRYKKARDDLAEVFPNNPLVDMWDRIVDLGMTTKSSLLASYQGAENLDLINEIATMGINSVANIQEFHDGIQTLITNLTKTIRYPNQDINFKDEVQALNSLEHGGNDKEQT